MKLRPNQMPDGCQAATVEYLTQPAAVPEGYPVDTWSITLICGDRQASLGNIQLKSDLRGLVIQALGGFCVNCPNRLKRHRTETQPEVSSPQHQYNPELVDWEDDASGEKVAIITAEHLQRFAAAHSKRVFTARWLWAALADLTYVDDPRKEFINSCTLRTEEGELLGLRADSARRLLTALHRGRVGFRNIGDVTLGLLDMYCEELYLNNPTSQPERRS